MDSMDTTETAASRKVKSIVNLANEENVEHVNSNYSGFHLGNYLRKDSTLTYISKAGHICVFR